MNDSEIINSAEALLLPTPSLYRSNNELLSDISNIQRLEQLTSTHNSLSSLEEAQYKEACLGARRNGRMSEVRRFFCLFVLFDFLFISLTWLICIMLVGGDNLIQILKMQVIYFKFTTSLFDVILVAFCRFTVLLLFYGLIQLNTTFFVAFTTLGTCIFLIVKVVYYSVKKWKMTTLPTALLLLSLMVSPPLHLFYNLKVQSVLSGLDAFTISKWTTASQPAFQVILVLISFVVAWAEAWFLDFRVLPQELFALYHAQSASRFSESLSTLLLDRNLRSVVMRHFLRGVAAEIESGTESVGNFYSPPESPDDSDDGSIDQKVTGKQPGAEYLRRGKDTLEVAWSILNDRDWKLQKKSPDGDCVYSKHEAHLGKVFLLRTKINIQAQKLLEELFIHVDKFTEWNTTVLESRRVQVIDEHTDITYQVSSSGGNGVISSRDFVNLRHWDLKGDAYVLAGISIPYPSLPPIKNYIRGENGPCCWVMRPLGESYESCTFEFLLNTNLKGWIPQYVLESALTSVLLGYSASLKEHCQSIKRRENT